MRWLAALPALNSLGNPAYLLWSGATPPSWSPSESLKFRKELSQEIAQYTL